MYDNREVFLSFFFSFIPSAPLCRLPSVLFSRPVSPKADRFDTRARGGRPFWLAFAVGSCGGCARRAWGGSDLWVAGQRLAGLAPGDDASGGGPRVRSSAVVKTSEARRHEVKCTPAETRAGTSVASGRSFWGPQKAVGRGPGLDSTARAKHCGGGKVSPARANCRLLYCS